MFNLKNPYKMTIAVIVLMLSILSIATAQQPHNQPIIYPPIEVDSSEYHKVNISPFDTFASGSEITTPYDLKGHTVVSSNTGTCLCAEKLENTKEWNLNERNQFYCTYQFVENGVADGITNNNPQSNATQRIYFQMWINLVRTKQRKSSKGLID